MEEMKIDLKCLEDFGELFNTIVFYNSNRTQVQCAKVLIAKMILSNLYIWNCTTGALGKHFRRNVYRFLRKFKTEDAMSCNEVGKKSEKGKVERIIRTGWELENPEKWEMGVNSKFSWNLVFTSPSVLLSLSLLVVFLRISAIQPKKLDNLCMTLHKFLISSLKQQGEVKTEKEKRRKKKWKTRKCRLWYENFPPMRSERGSSATRRWHRPKREMSSTKQ